MKKIICGLCACNCIASADAASGCIRGEPGSITHGFLCEKGLSLFQIARSEDRVKACALRGHDGVFHEIGMEEALDLLAARMQEIKHAHGASSFGFHSGQAGVRRFYPMLMRRLAAGFGSVNYSTIGSSCNTAKRMAYTYTMGGWPQCAYDRAGVIVLWGHSAVNSHPKDWATIKHAQARGAALISINPRRGVQSGENLELNLLPGTDDALAWLLLKLVVDGRYYDQDKAQRCLDGFPALLTALDAVQPTVLSHQCGVPLEKAEAAARLLGEKAPAAIMLGTAVELQKNGFQAARAVAILQALLGLEGVNFLNRAAFRLPPLAGAALDANRKVGARELPLFERFTGLADSNLFAQAIMRGELRGLLVCGGNPAATWNSTQQLKAALQSLDFFAVMDTHWTATAKLADLVIPAAATGEKDDLIECVDTNGDVYLNCSEAVFPSSGISETAFYHRLARRLGLEDILPWSAPEEFFDFLLRDEDFSFDDLRKSGSGRLYRPGTTGTEMYHRLEETGEKLRITLPLLAEYGFSPLPEPPAERRAPEAGELVLASSFRRRSLTGSRFRRVAALADGERPVLSMACVTAQQLNLREGQRARLSYRGRSISIAVTIDDAVLPGVGLCSHGWETDNVNCLSFADELDPVSGFPNLNGLFVRAEPEEA